MGTVRQPAVAGRFYPGDAETLRAEVTRLLGPDPRGDRTLGAVVPHAGYVYSGKVAGATFRRLAIPRSVVVLCPNHTGRGPRVSVWAEGSWKIPGAELPVDEELAARVLAEVPGAQRDVRAHEREHAIEVELPFLVALRPDVRIVPIVLGGLDGAEAAAVGEALAGCVVDAMVLASSDMSHYIPHDEAKARDRLAIDRLLALDPLGLHATCEAHDITMCGVLPATALLAYARVRGGARPELVQYATSGEAFGDYSSVVGYAGVLF
jgi:AmmeMemoRadiSam system protein B